MASSISSCLLELVVNLATLKTVSAEETAAREEAQLAMLTGPFKSMMDQIKGIFSPESMQAELKALINQFIPTSIEDFMQQFKDDPTGFSGLIKNSLSSFESFKSLGASQTYEIFDAIDKLITSLSSLNPESILSLILYVITDGLASLFIHEEILDTIEKAIIEIDKEVRSGNLPDEINFQHPFHDVLEKLCEAKNSFSAAEIKLTTGQGFDNGLCSGGSDKIKEARDILTNGGSITSDFVLDTMLNQFGIGDSIEQLKNKRFLPNYKIVLQKEMLVALMPTLGKTGNTLYKIKKSLGLALGSFQFNVQIEQFMGIVLHFIVKEIARIQNKLDNAVGDPQGEISQLKNSLEQTRYNIEQYQKEVNFSTDEDKRTRAENATENKRRLEAEAAQVAEALSAAQSKANGMSSDQMDAGSIVKSISAQVESIIYLSILVIISDVICRLFKTLDGFFGDANVLIKELNNILEKFSNDDIGEPYHGNELMCNLGKMQIALVRRISMQETDDKVLLAHLKRVKRSIVKQKRFTADFKRALGGIDSEILKIIAALGVAAKFAAMFAQGMSVSDMLKMFGLDFDYLFDNPSASAWEAIIKALVCIMESCDNPGLTAFAEGLMTEAKEQVEAEKTRDLDSRHTSQEAAHASKFKGNNRINMVMRMISIIQNLGICIPGANENVDSNISENNASAGNPWSATSGACVASVNQESAEEQALYDNVVPDFLRSSLQTQDVASRSIKGEN